MTTRDTPATQVWARPPVQRRSAPAPTDRPESLVPLVHALGAIAAAATAAEVAAAAVDGAVELTAARGAALGFRVGDDVRLLASTGYDCDSMRAGATLPLSAGLPLTEAVRTGRLVIRGRVGEPSWVALPVATTLVEGALLVSLTGDGGTDVAALQTLADATSVALRRCGDTGVTAAPVVRDWLHTAVLHEPSDPHVAATGDVVVIADGARDDIAWLVVADVCGAGVEAAPTAAVVDRLVRSLVTADLDPHHLLDAVERGLVREAAADRYVTAAAVRLRRTTGSCTASVATAGHPPALVWQPSGVWSLGGDALPLNLMPDAARPRVTQSVELPPESLLLLHTDGLVDRGVDDHSDLLADLFARSGQLADPAVVLDAVHASLVQTTPPARDDVAMVVAALR